MLPPNARAIAVMAIIDEWEACSNPKSWVKNHVSIIKAADRIIDNLEKEMALVAKKTA